MAVSGRRPRRCLSRTRTLGSNKEGQDDGQQHLRNGRSRTLFGTDGQDAFWGYGETTRFMAAATVIIITGGAGADYLRWWERRSPTRRSTRIPRPRVWSFSWRLCPPGRFGYGGDRRGRRAVLIIENLAGSEHDDVLSGDGACNELYGRNGNDTLKGGGGYDRLCTATPATTSLRAAAAPTTSTAGRAIDTAAYEGPRPACSSRSSPTSPATATPRATPHSIENVTGSATTTPCGATTASTCSTA